MTARFEVPFPPKPPDPRGGHLQPPWVSFEPRWEYKEIVRDLETDGLPDVGDLNALGAEHWELAGVAHESRRVHYYFKREKVR